MESQAQFLRTLRGLDGKPYSGYKALKGEYHLGFYSLAIDYVQSDPFAPPTRIRAKLPMDLLRLSANDISSLEQKIATEDFLTRRLAAALSELGAKRRGSGRSGSILIAVPGQVVLGRSSVLITPETIEVRMSIGLPANGRRIRAKDAEAMLLEDLPFLFESAFSRSAFPYDQLSSHTQLYMDQCALRRSLTDSGLIAFIGEGSILARRSGVSDLPMDEAMAVPFKSPDSLRVVKKLPSGRTVSGMGIKQGVTLIVGGGFHGKSTLLHAIEQGVYNHVEGDGREWCITNSQAVKIRAEDGRRVSRVDISGFINHLPRGRSTTTFSTQDASGSTSQSAAIVEAIELGATALLMDEDTCATNFMIRDARMQKLIVKEKEPITPFVDRVRELYDQLGVSTVLVIGGSGDYLDVANVVIDMDEYRPYDFTEKAKQVSEQLPVSRQKEVTAPLNPIRARHPHPQNLRNHLERIEAKAFPTLHVGDEFVDLSALEQMVDEGQLRAIAALMRYALHSYVDGSVPLRTVVEKSIQQVLNHGFESISSNEGCSGFYTLPRALELGMAWNRVRSLTIR